MIPKSRIHIVCQVAPWPLTSGSQIDLFYLIKNLQAEGISIILHYFSNPEERHPTELNPFCESIHIYRLVKRGPRHWPESIRLRLDPTLLSRLQQDQYPIILQGLSCCGFMDTLAAGQRKIIVRVQQLQHAYLQQKANNTRHPLQWIAWLIEKKRIFQFKKNLPQQVAYACTNESQKKYFCETLSLKTVFTVPVFSPFYTVCAQEGLGSFCLFHGDLSEKGTEKILFWLLTKVFSSIQVPFVIAGHNPSVRIEKLVHMYQHTCLVANPGETELDDLIQKAQTNILPSLHSSGTQLRVLHAVSMGRHCITTEIAVKDSPLRDTCHITGSARDMAKLIKTLQYQPIGDAAVRTRRRLLEEYFNPQKSTAKIMQHLW